MWLTFNFGPPASGCPPCTRGGRVEVASGRGLGAFCFGIFLMAGQGRRECPAKNSTIRYGLGGNLVLHSKRLDSSKNSRDFVSVDRLLELGFYGFDSFFGILDSSIPVLSQSCPSHCQTFDSCTGLTIQNHLDSHFGCGLFVAKRIGESDYPVFREKKRLGFTQNPIIST